MKRLITLSLLCCPVLLSAQGYQIHAQGQKQQAMGNTGTGFVQDGAGLFYNPGGVSFLKGNSASAGMSAAIVNTVYYDSITNTTTNSEIPLGTPITFYAVYGVDSTKSKVMQNFKFGLGVYTPFGGSAKWPDGWVGRFVTKSLDLKVICIQPTVSYKINDKIGVGAGFVYSMGSINVSKDIFISDTLGNYSTATIKGKMSGVGVNAGIYFKPTEAFSIGLTYRSQIKMNSKGATAEFKVPTSLKDSVPNGGAKLTFPLPTVISLGFGYKLTDEFTLAFDVNYLGFKVFDTLRLDIEKNTAKLKDIADPRKFNNTFSFHVGGQYVFKEMLTARLGMRYVISPIPDGYSTPDGGDADRLVLCGGVGYKINKHFEVDASYSFENVVRKDNNHFYNMIGTYKTYANFLGLSLAYNF